uniref:Uncharacterized protein n=1 Tax=Strongyloides papillosus TaxID=174720 RepID=A0A0N5BY09_STREA
MNKLILFICVLYFTSTIRCEDSEEYDETIENIKLRQDENAYNKYLYDKMVQHAAKTVKKKIAASSEKQKDIVSRAYKIPGPFEPYPGRSFNGDYLPLFPFVNQYSGGFDYDPSTARHIGGDINVPIPSWGILDINGHHFNRIRDTTTKFGFMNHPVNMLGLDKHDFVKLMSNPSLHHNREMQPEVPLGVVPRRYAPISCKAPFCNPYTGTFMFGVEHDIGGHDGNDGVIDVPIPVSKDTAYRFPFGGYYYYALDNITVTYGQHLSPIDPYSSYLFPDIKSDYFEKFSGNRNRRTRRFTNIENINKPMYEVKLIPKYIEIPIVYKPYSWLKPLYVTSIKKPFNSIASIKDVFSSYQLKYPFKMKKYPNYNLYNGYKRNVNKIFN